MRARTATSLHGLMGPGAAPYVISARDPPDAQEVPTPESDAETGGGAAPAPGPDAQRTLVGTFTVRTAAFAARPVFGTSVELIWSFRPLRLLGMLSLQVALWL